MPISDGLPTPPYGLGGLVVVVVVEVVVVVVVVDVADWSKAANCSRTVEGSAEVAKMEPSVAFVPFKVDEGTNCCPTKVSWPFK